MNSSYITGGETMKEKDQEILIKLSEWLQHIKTQKLTNWKEIPEIELYMDQVVNYVDRQLSHLKTEEKEKLLTPAMVNNYVKLGTLPKPEGKKYKKGHIARLFPLCVLKQILPLNVIGGAIDDFKEMLESEKAYEQYSSLQNDFLSKAAEQALTLAEEGENRLNRLEICAFELAIQAAANRVIAEKILKAVGESKQEARREAAERDRLKKEEEKGKREELKQEKAQLKQREQKKKEEKIEI